MKEAQTVVFKSNRFAEHRIVLDPRASREVNGRFVSESLDKKFEGFDNGLTVEFHNFIFETADPVIIEALKAHKDHGFMFSILDDAPVELSEEAQEKIATREEVVNEVGSTDENALKCDSCEFTGKTIKGLEVHKRTHA